MFFYFTQCSVGIKLLYLHEFLCTDIYKFNGTTSYVNIMPSNTRDSQT